MTDLRLEPAAVPEWDAEDLMAGRLGVELRAAAPEEALAMLAATRLELPDVLEHRELAAPDGDPFAYHLVELPMSILLPEDRRLVRLRMKVQLTDAVAYDLFPPDRWEDVVHDIGEVSVDVAKALTFVCPAPVADALGLKLKLPLRWKARDVRVRTSDRLSNPVEWYVTDSAISEGFTAYLIVRAAPGADVTLRAHVVCELRRAGPLGRVLKAAFRSGECEYVLPAA